VFLYLTKYIINTYIATEQLRKVKEINGKKPSAQYRARAFFNLFITNASEEVLSGDQIVPIEQSIFAL
jgi:hypothetical protein